MKISRLIEVLQKKLQIHGDIEMGVTWEGVRRPIFYENIYKGKNGVLYIDADENSYKQEFSADPTEGDDEREINFDDN